MRIILIVKGKFYTLQINIVSSMRRIVLKSYINFIEERFLQSHYIRTNSSFAVAKLVIPLLRYIFGSTMSKILKLLLYLSIDQLSARPNFQEMETGS